MLIMESVALFVRFKPGALNMSQCTDTFSYLPHTQKILIPPVEMTRTAHDVFGVFGTAYVLAYEIAYATISHKLYKTGCSHKQLIIKYTISSFSFCTREASNQNLVFSAYALISQLQAVLIS